MSRRLQLDMSYESMWSLLDEVPTEDLEAEVKHLADKAQTNARAKGDLEDKNSRISSKISVLNEVVRNRKRAELRKTLKPTEEHNKLMSLVSEDAVRKIIEGYFDDYRYLARELEWKLPNDDLSDEQAESMDELLEELPIIITRKLLTSKDSEAKAEK